jgi:1,5-anhydro-D-fructose reductase (1,5-anhydro-D-mannitol-forming)
MASTDPASRHAGRPGASVGGAVPAGTLRVAVVGLGLIGRQRAEALRHIEGAALAVTVDPASAVEPLDGVPHCATLAEVPPAAYDAVVVAVPHDHTAALAAEALLAGRPVLVEKPGGVCAAEVRLLEALAAEVALPSFVGYNYRYLPAVAELMRRVHAGAAGQLRNLDLLVGHGGHPGSAGGWKLDPVRAGGGVLLDPGVHLLDLLLALAPTVRCAAVEATHGFWPTGIEEDVVACFRDGPLVATVRVSHIRWVNTFRVEAFGADGYALAAGRGGTYGPMTLRLGRRWAWTQDGVPSQRESEEAHSYGTRDNSLREELAAVVARWRGAPEPPPGEPRPASFGEASRVAEVCEELYERLGRVAPPRPPGSARAAGALNGGA